MTVMALGLLALLVPVCGYELLARRDSRRLVARHLTSRPAETALVAAGSMLATALIVGSMVAGDSFEDSIASWAVDDLGAIDELVVLDDVEQLPSALDAVAALDEADDAAGLAVTAGLLRPAVDGDDRSVRTDVGVLADGWTVAGSLGEHADHPAGSLVLDEATADELGVAVGDRVVVEVPTGVSTLDVVEIGAATETLWLVPALIGAADAEALGVSSPAWQATLAVSNPGGARDGADGTDAAVAALERALADIGIDDTKVRTVKRDWLDAAVAEGEEMTALFGTVGGFGVAAGVLLIVNLFVMLAEERRRQLGTLRALGFGRARLVRLLAAEGLVHGLLAAVAGALGGLGIGAAIVAGSNVLLVDDGEPSIALSVVPASLVAGAAIGLAIGLITVLGAALRSSRSEIVSALADREPAPRPGRAWRARVGGLLLALAGSLGLAAAPDTALVLLVAPVAIVVGLGPLLSVLVDRSRAAILTSATALAWCLAVFEFGGEAMDEVEEGFFLAQGLLAVALTVRLLVGLEPLWHRLGRTRVGLSVRLGLLEPLEHRGRTSLLIAMYALVVFTLTFVSTLSAVFGNSTEVLAVQAAGRFDAVVDVAAGTLDEAEVVALDPVADAVAVERATLDRSGGETLRVTLVDTARFGAVGQGPDLDTFSAEWSDPAQVWAAVADSGTTERPLVVTSDDEAWVVGDTIELVGVDGPVVVEVAAVARHTWVTGSGSYLPDALAPALLGRSTIADRFWIDVGDGSEAGVVAADLEAQPELALAEIMVISDEAARETANQESFLAVFNGYLAVGLVIGVAGLAVVLVRSVRERRRTLAILRAVGIGPEVIRRSFLVEGALIGTQGVLTGAVLGVVTAWMALARSSAFLDDLSWTVPWLELTVVVAVAVAASAGAAVVPSLRAGRVPPAAALRV